MTLAFSPPPCPDSPLRRLDPRWKLAGLLLLLLTVALLRHPLPLSVALGFTAGLAFLGRLPPRWVRLRLAGLALFIAPFALTAPFLSMTEASPLAQWGPLTVHQVGLERAFVLTVKATTLALVAMLILATSPLDATLKAAHALRVPGLLIQLTLLSYRYAVHLAGEMRRLRVALRLRGYRQGSGPHSLRTLARVTGTVLVRSHERGERVAQAMACRGFDGRYRSLMPFRTHWLDVLFLLGLTACSACLLCWDLTIMGGGRAS